MGLPMISVLAVLLMLVGAVVSVGFWVPRFFNRARLRELLGSRYPAVYVIYLANGPMLVVVGLLLLYRFG